MPGEIRLICKHAEALPAGTQVSVCWKRMGVGEQEVKVCETDIIIVVLTPCGPLSVLGNSSAVISPVSFTLTPTPTHPDRD